LEESYTSLHRDIQDLRTEVRSILANLQQSSKTDWGTLAGFGGLILAFSAAVFSPYAFQISRLGDQLQDYPAVIQTVTEIRRIADTTAEELHTHELLDAHATQRERQQRTDAILQDMQFRLSEVEKTRFTRKDWMDYMRTQKAFGDD